MSSERPAITVITVVFNAKDLVKECVDSVLAQSVEGIEYIVIDGGSTDGTLDILRGYGDRISRLVSEPDRGLYDAMNKGLKLARGRFIHFLNADDRYVSGDVLSSILPELDAGALCYGQMRYVENGQVRLLGEPFKWRRELRASHIPQPVTFVAPEIYSQVGFFDASLKIAADYDMVLRIAKRFPVKFIPLPVTEMHAGGVSYRRPDLTFAESMIVSRRNGLGLIPALSSYVSRTLKWKLKYGLMSSLQKRL
jgi:glycosyltransferase involved in cell wall biosynthesis